jgi:predicted PurR-regulated permease PerM
VSDPSPSLKPWVQVIGTVTIVAALWAARDIAFPIVLAALLTFLLSPPVSWFERRIGRIPAVLGVVGIGFAGIAIALMIVTWQLDGLVRDLPRYRQTLVSKLAELRNAGRGGAVEELQKTFEDVKEELGGAETREEPGSRRRPTVVLAERLESGQSAFPWLGSILGMVTQVGVVVTLVIFMLLERRDLRDRIIGVIGRGHVALTTKALDEASSRVSRQLLMQGVVNALYGAAAALGLWYLGVPYAMLWAALGSALRFIPYLGPVLAAGAPIIISAAASDGWKLPLQVSAFYAILELFTNLVLETVLYAGAAGVSQVGLLLSVTFWTWLWGPAGLLVATPLTVVLVVLGKHVRGFEAIATMMADTTALPPSQGVYQRLLARDTAEAADLVERHARSDDPRSVYDALLLPTLNFAEADRLEGRLTAEEESQVYASLQELIGEAADQVRRVEEEAAESEPPAVPAWSIPPVKVLGWAANGAPDEVALAMLARLVDDLPVEVTIRSKLMATEMIEVARDEGIGIVCLVDLPPGSPSRTRYLLKKLHDQAPELRLLVGRWAPPEHADTSTEPLIRAGASHVGQSLADTRDVLQAIVEAAAEAAAPVDVSVPTVDEASIAPAS